MTEPETDGEDTADPQHGARDHEVTRRPWWRTRVGAVAAAIVVAVIAVGGYCGVKALRPQPARQSTSPSAPGIFNQVKGLPPGADQCPRIYANLPGQFNAGARGTPATSCAFVEEVRKQYSAQNPPAPEQVQLSVVSPQTSRWYKLACLRSHDYVTCTGGAAAVIYLYNRTDSE